MWKEKKYRTKKCRFAAKECNRGVKTLFTRRRKWQRFLQQLTNAWSHDFTVNGIYLDLDKKGWKKRCEKISFSSLLNPVITQEAGRGKLNTKSSFTFSLSSSITNDSHHTDRYIWSKSCRFIRLKMSSKRKYNHSKSKQKRVFTGTKKIYKFSIKRKLKKENKIKYGNTGKPKGMSSLQRNFIPDRKCQSNTETTSYPETNVSGFNDFCIESLHDFEEISFDEFDKPKVNPRPFLKRMPKSCRYLYSDAYLEKRHSKRRSLHLKNLMEDTALTVKNKSHFNFETTNIYSSYYIEDEEDVEELSQNGSMLSNSCILPTFGDYLLSTINAEINNQIPPNPRDDTVIILKESQFNVKEEIASNGIENIKFIDRKNSDEDLGDVGFEKDESKDNIVLPSPSETMSIKGEERDHDMIEQKQNDEIKQSIVFLSRLATRPDNLRKDFKLNYKEAQCKPRRFIINITHLAYQNFVLNSRQPLHIIPQLDLSLYLMFSFLREAKDEADEYRVEINTSLPFKNPKYILAHLSNNVKIKSIHEIMQTVILAFDNLKLDKLKKKVSLNSETNFTHKAMHSFNLLTSACRWNIQIIDSPHSLEWYENSSNMEHLSLAINPNSSYNCVESMQPKLSSTNELLSTKIKGRKQGPTTPSLCGICLQDFNGNKYSIPMALNLCSHWFCETCWKSSFYLHFNSNSSKNNSQLMCLEEGCTSLIDTTSLLSLLPLEVVRDYEMRKLRFVVENNSQLKLCPNPSCKRIIFAKKPQETSDLDQVINVTCSCLFQKCFSCMACPHWPLSCGINKIYERRMDALNHDNFQRQLEEKEFPDVVLKGKSCPKCGVFIQVSFKFSGLKQCDCGCRICWPCGKEVRDLQEKLHVSCSQIFQIEDDKFKHRINRSKLDHHWVKNGEMTKWYKIALLHRQNQHPQVVNILYKMADHVAETINEISRKGKYVGNDKQAAKGWESQFRKLAHKRSKLLKKITDSGKNKLLHIADTTIQDHELTNSQEIEPQSISLNCSLDSYHLQNEQQSPCDSPEIQNQSKRCDPMLIKAISNIVDTKLELHYVIEHLAVLLEYSHALHQPGKVIRCLERAEDLCTCLDMLLQPTHAEGSSRIIPSYLRLRSQIVNILSTIQCCLKENAAYHCGKITSVMAIDNHILQK